MKQAFVSNVTAAATVLAALLPLNTFALDVEGLVARNPRPPASHIIEVTHQNGRWIVGAENGVISHSADGTDWSTVTVSYQKGIESIAYWNGDYYASGVDNATLLTSPDLVDWTESHPDNFPYNGRQLLPVNGSLYAVGDSPDLAVTTDGLDWQEVILPVEGRFEGLAWSGSRFVLVGTVFDNEDADMDGDTLEGIILSSENGTVWTTRLVNVPITGSGLEDDFLFVEWINGRFVAGGKQGLVATSADGIAWTVHATTFDAWVYGASYLGGTYYIPGRQGKVHTTSDFADWQEVQTDVTQTLQDIFESDGQLLAGGRDGLVVTSTDGQNWPITTAGTREFIYELEYGNGVYVAADASAEIWWSADSESWISAYQDTEGDYLEGLVWDGAQFVGMSAGGFLLTSSDGQNWTESPARVLNGRVERLRRLNDSWWAVGADGLIASSSDLVTWNSVTEGSARFLDIAFGDGTYVISGITGDNAEGIIYSSTDGVVWTPQTTHLPAENGVRLNTVAHANNTFVVLGQGSVLLTSPDGVTWTSRGVQGQSPFNSQNLSIIGGSFVAPDLNGIVRTSTDGITWTPFQARTTRAFYDILDTADRTVAVGSNGAIMSSPVALAQGYIAWVQARFTSQQQSDPNIVGIDKDPDADGRPNGLEYFSNTPPLSADVGLPFTPTIVSDFGNDYPGIEIQRRTNLSDAEIALRRSTDVAGGWTLVNSGDIVEVSVTPLDAETESVLFRINTPQDPGGQDYLQAGATVTD